MRLGPAALAAFALTALLANALVTGESESSILSAIKKPFKKAYRSARNFKQRALSRLHATRIEARSAVSPASGAEPAAGRDVAATSSRSSISADFKAACFVERGPTFKKPPKLFFYAAKRHAPDTFGCEAERTKQFVLKPKEVENEIHGGVDLTLDRATLQRDLFDSDLFDPAAPTYFVIHGFMSSWNSPWLCDVKDLVLNSTTANVFIVDWSGGAKPTLPIDYGASVSNTQYVGAVLGEFIKTLLAMTQQADASQYHLIGHSLGAHISGFAGYYVGSLGRITALDPAGPCFGADEHDAVAMRVATEHGKLEDGRRRLSPDSANFVVALHTDANLFGLDENCAHYDVYVNGGTRQPKCGGSSLSSRLDDLVHLNLDDYFDLNIGCSHSFAHKLVQTFVSFVRQHDDNLNGNALARRKRQAISAEEDPQGRQLIVQNPLGRLEGQAARDQCFPVAFECADWKAFKAGECGFCRDHDPRCVFTGLSLTQEQSKKLVVEPSLEGYLASGDEQVATGEQRAEDDDEDDDDQFNDENDDDEDKDDEDNVDEQEKKPEAENLQDAEGKPSPNFRDQHFMRAANGAQTCLFQYQIIVAAKRRQIQAIEDEGRHYHYYLDLPLELSGRLTDAGGARLHDRLVQVSHRVDPQTRAHERLRTDYLESLREEGVALGEDERNNLELYTAMITFAQAPSDACEAETDDETNGASRQERWQICKPLRNVQEARLWSSSERKLSAVAWVALNYMSGVSYDIRRSNSYVLKGAPGETLQSRSDVDKAARPGLNQLEPVQRRSLVSAAGESAECLLSVFDTGRGASARRNFKCNRSSRELKVAIRLEPVQASLL